MATAKLISGQLGGITISMSATENSSFPMSNLKTYFAADLWKSSAMTTAQWLKFDLGVARAVNCVIFSAHNIETMGQDGVYLQYDANDNAAFTSPMVAYTFDAQGAPDPYYGTFTSQTKRYWRLVFDTDGITTPEAGNVFLAKYFEMAGDWEFGFSPFHPRFKTTVHETKTGVIRTRSEYGGRREMRFECKLQDDTWLSEFQRFLDEVAGMRDPFYFVDTAGVIWYVHFGEDYIPPRTIVYGRHNTQNIILKKQLCD